MNRTVRALVMFCFMFVAFVSLPKATFVCMDCPVTASVDVVGQASLEQISYEIFLLKEGQGITQALEAHGCDRDWLKEAMELSGILEEKLRELPIGTPITVPIAAVLGQEAPVEVAEESREIMRRDMARHRDVAGYNVFGEAVDAPLAGYSVNEAEAEGYDPGLLEDYLKTKEELAEAHSSAELLRIRHEQLEREVDRMKTESDTLRGALAAAHDEVARFKTERDAYERALEGAEVELNALNTKLQEELTWKLRSYVLSWIACLVVGVAIGWYWRWGHTRDLRAEQQRKVNDLARTYNNDLARLRDNLAKARGENEILRKDSLGPATIVVGVDDGLEETVEFRVVSCGIDPAHGERSVFFCACPRPDCRARDLQVDRTTLSKERLLMHLIGQHGMKKWPAIHLVKQAETA